MKRLLLLLAACGHDPKPAALDGGIDAPASAVTPTGHSSSIAISADGKTLYVVNADSDSVSSIDIATAAATEIPLGTSVPTTNASGDYVANISPRALALDPSGTHLYVTGQRSGAIYDITLANLAVSSAPVCPEPIGVVASTTSVYVACTADHAVVRLDRNGLPEVQRATLDAEPWSLAWQPDGSLLAPAFYGAGATVLDPTTMAVRSQIAIPAIAPRSDARLAHGQPRGFYDVANRPNTQEMWLVHTLLGTDTAQPTLDFERTAFPAISIISSGTYATTLSTDAQDVAGIDGSFGDVVSGPHAIEFTHDGSLALVVDTNSEDVLAVSSARVEAALARPLPGHMPEGIAIALDDSVAYIDERNTGDVAIVKIGKAGSTISLTADGSIHRFAADPMPTQMRLGQHLFFSANSDEYAVTKNHWIACATCHMEGRSDQVTWLFAQGPRDTPSNAGGTLATGFLFRTADRNRVQDYWHTVNVEQGGAFDPTAQAALLDAIEVYVDHAIPLPIPPTLDPAKVSAGSVIFHRADVGCATCHTGAAFTDSGTGNPTLDLGGTVLLHDVGTCNAGDVAHLDVAGHARAACMFDTPSLRGVDSTPPYFHDGRAATLHDALEMTRGTMGDITSLSADDEDALVQYLRSL